MPLVPWVVVRARAFQLRRSEFRGIAFDFRGRYRDAAVWYPLSWAASIVTLGLARPFTVFGRDRFLVTESSFGNMPFRFVGRPGRYYGLYIVTAIVVGALYAGGAFFLFLVVAATATSGADTEAPAMRAAVVGSLILVAAVLLFILSYLRARLLGYRWTCSRLGDNEFSLHLAFPTMLWLYLSNTAMIATTFGLFIPFARIRVLRYIVGEFRIFQRDDVSAFETGDRQRVGAAGAEAAGEFGLEMGM